VTQQEVIQLGYVKLTEHINEQSIRIARLLNENNATEDKRRALALELKVTRSALRSIMETLAKRDDQIRELEEEKRLKMLGVTA
jgi:hypothetical protein